MKGRNPNEARKALSYEQILAGLPSRERRMVHDVVASSVVEGDIPDLKSVARLADVAAGKITGDQYRSEVLREHLDTDYAALAGEFNSAAFNAERRAARHRVAGSEQ
jgi:hypothetical protein